MLPAVSRIAHAQAYPTKPVRLIVGFAAGGTFDTLARPMAQWLSERYRQQFVIENRPGGGGTIGTEAAVRAPSDTEIARTPNRHHLLDVCVLQAPTTKLGALIVGASDPGEHALAAGGPARGLAQPLGAPAASLLGPRFPPRGDRPRQVHPRSRPPRPPAGISAVGQLRLPAPQDGLRRGASRSLAR
jgi:Tripartite tricarboxylate transporter family receptor